MCFTFLANQLVLRIETSREKYMTATAAARRPRPWWVAVVNGMASYVDAAAIISMGTALVILQPVLGLSPVEIGIGSATLTFGVAIGALVGGRLGDQLGRRPVFMTTMALIIIGAAILILAPSFVTIVIGAALIGVGTGGDLPVSLATIAEAADDSNRGKLLGLSNIFWLVGALIPAILGGVVGNLGVLGAQILLAHIGIVALLLFVGRISIPESDVWIASKREHRNGIRTVRADRTSVRELLRGPYLAPFIALIVFYSLSNLVANTQGQFGTYMLVNFGSADVATASLLGLVTLPLGIVGFLWFMRIADKPSRFTYFTVGAVAYIAAPLVLAIFGISIPTYLVAAVLTLIGASFAFEGIMKVWSQESFPTLLRSTAQGTIVAVARFVAALVASITPLVAAAGPSVLYFTLAAVTTVGMGTAWFVFRKRTHHSEFDTESVTDPGLISTPR